MFDINIFNNIYIKPEHKSFLNIYCQLIQTITSTYYHDDSAIWNNICSKKVYENNDFYLIYQPHKGILELDNNKVTLIIIGKHYKITKTLFNQVKYIIDYINELTLLSFKLLLKITNNNWYVEYNKMNIISILNIEKNIHFYNSKLKITYNVQGMDDGICNILWKPIYLEMLIKNDFSQKIYQDYITHVQS